jgi:hypothetical protein
VLDGEGTDGVADQGGHGRGGDALAADVAQDDAPRGRRELEDVVEVAADLPPQTGGPVGGGDVEVLDPRGRGWDEGLLQRLGEVGCVLARRLGGAGRLAEVVLVAVPVTSLEKDASDGAGPDRTRRVGVEEHRDSLSVGAQDVEGDLTDDAVVREHGQQMRLEEDPTADGHQGREGGALNIRDVSVHQPEELGVGSHDEAVVVGDHVSTGRVREQVVFDVHRVHLAPRLATRTGSVPRNSRMAATVASGALRCGQWPWVSMTA